MRKNYYLFVLTFLKKQFSLGKRYRLLQKLLSFKYKSKQFYFNLKKNLYKFIRFLKKCYYRGLVSLKRRSMLNNTRQVLRFDIQRYSKLKFFYSANKTYFGKVTKKRLLRAFEKIHISVSKLKKIETNPYAVLNTLYNMIDPKVKNYSRQYTRK
jgi:hypothetical protein